jgi:hypothetical protein
VLFHYFWVLTQLYQDWFALSEGQTLEVKVHCFERTSVSWCEFCAVGVRLTCVLRLKQNLPENLLETFDGWWYECEPVPVLCPLFDIGPHNYLEPAVFDSSGDWLSDFLLFYLF